MLRKKNYIRQNHYEYSLVQVPKVGGGKRMLYFRRYKPVSQERQRNTLYQVMEQDQPVFKDQPQEKECHQRMLQVINFDAPMDAGQLKRVFRLLGKVRNVDVGDYRQKGKPVYFGLVTFKFQFDLVKAFRSDYLQNLINEAYQKVKLEQTRQEKEEYLFGLVQQHGGEVESDKVQKLQALREEGFHVVTDKFGNFETNPQSNQRFIQDLPQVKKREKEHQKSNRKKHQMPENGEEPDQT